MKRGKNVEVANEEDIKLDLEPLEIENKDDIVVEAAEEKEEAPAPEVKTKEPELSVEDGIRELKFKLEEERQARLAAEQQARQATEKVTQARGEVDDTNLKLIDNAIETVKRNEQILKQNLRTALAEQDVDKVAEIQAEIATSAVQKLQLEQGRSAYEQRMREAAKVMPVPQDPVEALASQLSPRSAAWVRAHPEYAKDQRLYQKMVAAHNLAVADGVEADTDDYFNNIETTLKINNRSYEQQDSAMSDAASPTQRRSSPPAAPVSRTPTNNSGTRPNVVRLTAQEREMASMMGMTDQEYARNKVALIKEGKLN